MADDRNADDASENETLNAPAITRRAFLHTVGFVGAGLALGSPSPVQSASGTVPHQSIRADAPFVARLDGGTLVSLKRAGDQFETDYIQPGKRLGEALLRFRGPGEAWTTAETSAPGSSPIISQNADGSEYKATYLFGRNAASALSLEVRFAFQDQSLFWTMTARNLSDVPLEIGDIALPLPINTSFDKVKTATEAVFKHSFISGDGSFLFWMRCNSVGPYLTMTPLAGSPLEYWDSHGVYRVYLHSAAAGAEAAAHGGRWRQPHTSVTLAPHSQVGAARTYGFRFDWAADYAAVRETLVRNGLIDVSVVPGMTVPSDLSARLALRTDQKIVAVEAEFPATTQIIPLGAKHSAQLYDVRFHRLGENRLTVRYGDGRTLYLEFFSTEPLETLSKKRGAFIAAHRQRDPARWYNGLLSEWNMASGVVLSPDNYDLITGWRIYEVTCDDPGLSKPAFLASKNAEFPVQNEVTALDDYVQHFVWGGLQRSTEETFPYGIYGIPDWKTNRDSPDPGSKGKLHLWRPYDYSHIVVMYFGLYRIAKNNPQMNTALTAAEYLRRAAGTALALFTVPLEIVGWSAYETGFYNERVIVELIDALQADGFPEQAAQLRRHWEKKVRFFVEDQPDLFGSEYPFDSTGFESTHALAKYALEHEIAGVRPADAQRFLKIQIAANIFCRGSIEPAYYLLGSDYRGGGGDAYTLTYMSQMGGWAVLDYGLNYAADPMPYVRLGYASYLSAWALMNTGTPQSGYGYWYPGPENDGGAGGGFEPAAYGTTWLGQPHHRGSWYYSSEIDLGYCGALRMAATVLMDDPLFGRICYGGDWKQTPQGLEVIPKDGVRRRFHALLGGQRLSLISDTARFPAGQPLVFQEDFSLMQFRLESDNPAKHLAKLCLSGFPPGSYIIHSGSRQITELTIQNGKEATLTLPMAPGSSSQAFSLKRRERMRKLS